MLKNLYNDDYTKSKYVLINDEVYIEKQYKVDGDYTQLLNEIKNLNSKYLKKIAAIKFENNKTTYYEQYVEGVTLNKINFNKLTLQQVKHIFIQVSEGLEQLHKINLIHRDIKPENIIVNQHYNIKIIDFDIIRKVDGSKNKDTVLLGTNKYASPEHFGFGETNVGSDIYSLGMTIKQLLELTIHYKKFEKIINNATNLNVQNRYKNVSEVKNALKQIKKRNIFLTISSEKLFIIDYIIVNIIVVYFVDQNEENVNMYLLYLAIFVAVFITTKLANKYNYYKRSFLFYFLYSMALIIYYAAIVVFLEMLYI